MAILVVYRRENRKRRTASEKRSFLAGKSFMASPTCVPIQVKKA